MGLFCQCLFEEMYNKKKPHHLGKLRDSGKELKEAYLLIQGK